MSVLVNRTYRRLLSAEIVALVGTELATIALGLLAMDVVRAAVVLLLPFVDQIWQVYVLIFALQSASAAFIPAFQVTIPDIFPDKVKYTRALSLSQLAYDLESLPSPMLAAALLSVISFHWLFGRTAIGFVGTALLVMSVTLQRLRRLLAVNLSSAAASAMVIVNTVVIVREVFGFGQREVALSLAAYGSRSMLAALALSRLLDRIEGRTVMLGGALVLTAALAALGLASGAMTATFLAVLLAGWFVIGMAYAAALTLFRLLLRRSVRSKIRTSCNTQRRNLAMCMTN